MSKPSSILVFVPCYIPGYKSGGPIRTVSSIVETCGDDLGFRLITKDRDAGDLQPYSSVAVDRWNQVGKATVFYASPKTQSFAGFYRAISDADFDVLYLNSFFHPVFTLKPLILNALFFRKPVVLCPRGEFSPGALEIKSPKKQLFIRLFRLLGWQRRVRWQATSPAEADLIRGIFGPDVRIRVAQNISLPTLSDGSLTQKSTPLKIAFLSRISQKKNLIGALRSLSAVRSPVSFDVYGPASRPEDIAYREECQRLAETLPDHIAVRFCGEVEHSVVSQTLSGYDLFFLPTLGENFGHAILEALAAGLPILIADTAPWRDLEAKGIGWDLGPHDYEGYAKNIDQVAAMTADEHKAMRKVALNFAKNYIYSSPAVTQTKELFAWAINIESQKELSE